MKEKSALAIIILLGWTSAWATSEHVPEPSALALFGAAAIASLLA